jgi:hypothetical protein
MGAMTAACLSLMFTASCQKAEQGITEEVAYLRGMESWVYGYPIVLMDVTRQVLTAAPAPNAEGTAVIRLSGRPSSFLPPPPQSPAKALGRQNPHSSYLLRNSGTAGWLHRAEPGLVRLYVASPPAAKHTRNPTRIRPLLIGQMVPAIGGGQLDDGLASPFPDVVAAKPRTRPDLCAPWAAADELLCNGTMDGVLAIRPDRTPDHHKFRHDDRLSPIQKFLGPLDCYGSRTGSQNGSKKWMQ